MNAGDPRSVADSVTDAVGTCLPDGYLLTGMTCFVRYLTPDGEQGWSFAVADGQLSIDTAGMVAALVSISDASLAKLHSRP